MMGGSKIAHPEIQPSMHSGVNTKNTCPFNPHANCSQLQDAQRYEHATQVHVTDIRSLACLKFLALSFNIRVTWNYKVHRTHTRMRGQRRQRPTSEVLQAGQAS